MESSQDRMTEGSIAGKLVGFAVPLFIGNLFQQLYNTCDALIVGNIIGNNALAAVSATGSLIFLIISLFSGITMGAGVAVSRYFGARQNDKLRLAVHTNMAFNLVSAIILTAFGTSMASVFLRWMGTPEEVFNEASIYIRIFFAGSISMVLYNCLRGIMQAVGDSKHPLYYLILSSLTNVVLDIVFIAVFGMGVDGAAYATVLSQFLSVILCLRRLLTTQESYRLIVKEIRFDPDMLREIIKYGLPSGFQNSVIAIANVVVQSNINAFGTMAVSGCGAYAKIEGFAFLPITSFTIALTTFIGQNLGAMEYDRAKKGALYGSLCAILLSELVGAIFYLCAPFLISLFTSEPDAIAFGAQKSRICCMFYCLLSASHCMAAVLRGAGKSVVPMLAMLISWCIIRVGILKVFVPIYRSIAVVNWVYPITWAITTVFLFIYLRRADWVHGFDAD